MGIDKEEIRKTLMVYLDDKNYDRMDEKIHFINDVGLENLIETLAKKANN